MLAEIEKMITSIIEQIDAKIPMEDNPKKLKILREKYQTALQEIEKDGQIKIHLNGMVRQYLESYSDYMNNPLLEDMGRLELLIELPQVGFVRSVKCNDIFVREILRGRKVLHRTSQPVVFFDKGKYYLAAFAFFYTKDDIKSGSIDRPTLWALADIETGEIVKIYEVSERDFSNAPYDQKYNIRPDGKYDMSREYYDKAFLILDFVRSKLINDGKFCKGEYQYYLNMILANVPKEYQRFYTDLSI